MHVTRIPKKQQKSSQNQSIPSHSVFILVGLNQRFPSKSSGTHRRPMFLLPARKSTFLLPTGGKGAKIWAVCRSRRAGLGNAKQIRFADGGKTVGGSSEATGEVTREGGRFWFWFCLSGDHYRRERHIHAILLRAPAALPLPLAAHGFGTVGRVAHAALLMRERSSLPPVSRGSLRSVGRRALPSFGLTKLLHLPLVEAVCRAVGLVQEPSQGRQSSSGP